jgi:hypothetical protein
MDDLPKATRPLEYVGFIKMDVRTGEGLAHIFAAVDAYMDYALVR